jgi:hypothetical protein
MAALAPKCRVSYMAHVVALGHVPGSVSLRNVVAHLACLFYVIQHPSTLCVTWVGRRASGSVSLGEGVCTGWQWILYPLLRRTWVRAPW